MDGLWIISAAVADAWRFLLLIWLSLFSDVIIEQTAVVCFVVSTEKKPPKRPLKVRISEETREILKNPMGLTRDCLVRRLKAARAKVHKVNPAKGNKTYALTQLYDQRTGRDIRLKQSDHIGFFAATIIVRQLFSLSPLLRKSKFKGYQLKINGRFIQQSLLFGRGSDAMSATIFASLCNTMGSMHLHNVFTECDTFHTSVSQLIEREANGAERVRLLSFFFEFAFLVHFAHNADELRRLADLSPEHFAKHCYDNGYNPVSPRFGQGKGGKSWHPKLTGYLEGREETAYIELVVDIYKRRVLTKPESLVVFSVCQLPAEGGRMSRIKLFQSIFVHTKGYGPFAKKNYMEAYMAHNIFAGATQEELKQLEDGPGASHYWTTTKITRQAMLKALSSLFDDMRMGDAGFSAKTICVRDIATGNEHLYSLRDLGVTKESLNEGVLQFWSCAQGRIFDIWNNFLRCKANPVDFHLLPTQTILADIKARVRQTGRPAAA